MEGTTAIPAAIKGGLYTADIPAAATDTNATRLRTPATEETGINIIRTATAAQANPCLNILHEVKGVFQPWAEDAFVMQLSPQPLI